MLSRIKLGAMAGCGLFCAVLASGAAVAAAPPQAPGVWQKHEYSFAFMGFTSTYSCDGLADKLRILLIAAGARPDATARAGACASGFGRPDKFARADLTFYTLGPPGSDPGDSKPVDGTWIPVTISRRQPRELGTGDCELVEQFRTGVLPMFATRNVESHITCIPHQLSGSVIDLKFESFTVPQKERRPPHAGKARAIVVPPGQPATSSPPASNSAPAANSDPTAKPVVTRSSLS